jgi:hypothetical protein
MIRLRFVKPSLRRLVGCTTAVAVVCSLAAGLFLYGAAIATLSDTDRPSGGEYVRLLLLDLTFWGPVLLLTCWKYTTPLALVLGSLTAGIRRVPPAPD